MKKEQVISYAKKIIDNYDSHNQDYISVLSEFLDKEGSYIPHLLHELYESKELNFYESLLLARLFLIIYELSDNHFSYYSHKWVISSVQMALSHSKDKEQEMYCHCVLFNALAHALLNHKEFYLSLEFNCDWSEETKDYSLTFDSISAKEKFSCEIYLFLYYFTPRLMAYFADKPNNKYWNQIYAGKLYGNICSFFESYKLTNLHILYELSKNCYDEFEWNGQEFEDFDYLDYCEIVEASCKFDVVNNVISQYLSDEDIEFLDFCHQ